MEMLAFGGEKGEKGATRRRAKKQESKHLNVGKEGSKQPSIQAKIVNNN